MEISAPDESHLSAFGLDGQIAVVTGAASGLGKVTAQLFAATGAKVIVADVNLEGAEKVAADINGSGGRAVAVQCDIAEGDSVRALFDAAEDAFGVVTVLINNAAFRPKADFLSMSVDQWDQMHEVNTRGTFLCIREAIRRMKAASATGSIVNISTVGTVHPTIYNNTHYDSSKAGINAMTRTAASEFASDGIRVNAVLPGGINTEGMRKISAGGDNVSGPMTQSGRIPFGRAAEPIEMARAVLFLASPAASYITGQLLAVDGGYLVG